MKGNIQRPFKNLPDAGTKRSQHAVAQCLGCQLDKQLSKVPSRSVPQSRPPGAQPRRRLAVLAAEAVAAVGRPAKPQHCQARSRKASDRNHKVSGSNRTDSARHCTASPKGLADLSRGQRASRGPIRILPLAVGPDCRALAPGLRDVQAIVAGLNQRMPIAAFLVSRVRGDDRRLFRLILGHALAGNWRMRVISGTENPAYVAGFGRRDKKAAQNEENRVVSSHGGVVLAKDRQINNCRIVAFRSAKVAFSRGAKGDTCLGKRCDYLECSTINSPPIGS